MDLRDKKVVVVGLGVSGESVCRFCRARGAQVLGVDDKDRASFPEAVATRLEGDGVELFLGGQPEARLAEADVVVVSPGVPSSPALDAAEARGVPLVAEVELASWFIDAPIVAITGTNGKSTVTALIGEMLSRTGRPTFVGGNLGTALIDAVGTAAAEADGRVVAELSSFQLERIAHLKPAVSVLLNVTEDHLDRYPTMAAYTAAKGRIFVAQDEADAAVVNGDDPLCVALAGAGRAKVHRFGSRGSERCEVYEADGAVVDEGTGETYALAAFKLAGAHNRSNACAAILAARLAGAPPDAIAGALESFTGLPHRMEYVGEARGVSFYDDSKATNVGAAVAALLGMDRPVVLIAGGRDKGGDYGPLREQVVQRARAVVLIGEAATLMEEALAGPVPIVRAGTMKEAVERAATEAQPGDAVVLAPACSSFDMFANYKARGEAFSKAVANFLPPRVVSGDAREERGTGKERRHGGNT